MGKRKNYTGNSRNLMDFNKLRELMTHVPKGVIIGTYEPDQVEKVDGKSRTKALERNYLGRGGMLELFGKMNGTKCEGLYRWTTSSPLEHRREILNWLESGKIALGHANSMKFRGKEINI